MADDDVTELEDVGDLWLTFWVVLVLATLAGTAALSFVTPVHWALVIAALLAAGAAGLACNVRIARRLVSQVAQLFFFWA